MHLLFQWYQSSLGRTGARCITSRKMQSVFVFVAISALLAVTLAAPQGKVNDVVVVKESPHNNIGIGGYEYGYELSNGESRQESAQLKNAGAENEVLAVSGSYTYIDEISGQRYSVTYTADENGFRAEGAHIPA